MLIRNTLAIWSTWHCNILIFCLLYLCPGCTSGNNATNNNESTKFQQYYLQGEQLYKKNCSNCHQIGGTGLGLLYPPINKSDFIDRQFNDVVCLVKNGKKGELKVNGLGFNKTMPPMPSLTNLEVAEIATYIYNTWEHKRGIVDVKAIDLVLAKCK